MASNPRLGLLWRGESGSEDALRAGLSRIQPLVDALARRPVDLVPVLYDEATHDEARAALIGLDGVMVWVNPIQDGRTRSRLDELLREAAAAGVWVSAHPDTILRLGTKAVLHAARHLPWGSDVELYATAEDFAERFPTRLADHGTLVVKQGRGNGGNGVWKVSLLISDGADEGGDRVAVQDARGSDGSWEPMRLADLVSLCTADFHWSQCIVDQPFQPRLSDGAVRCYFSEDAVVGFARQWPTRGLLDDVQAAATRDAARASVSLPADAPQYAELRGQAEREWLPPLLAGLGLDGSALPAIWDADLLFGEPDSAGKDSFVLCEVNVSAVWPFPAQAAEGIATTVMRRLNEPGPMHASAGGPRR